MPDLAGTIAADMAFTSPARATGFLRRLPARLARIDAAFDGQSLLSAITTDTTNDTHLSPADLTGIPTHDPDLPFFLQSRFGSRDR